MVNNHVEKKAVKFSPMVRKYSEITAVSRSLIFAVMKTESGFNPFAVSSAPAFGLMQLVPASGGRDAYRKARGLDVPPTKEYLFEPENNIELGSTYLGVLMNDSPLKGINDPVSREYCAIAAYNTGAGNVFRAFSDSKASSRQADALDRINSIKPEEVYATLRTSLPYEETRSYIVKVVSAKKHYAAM
jgi:membrane-bound lytic murein transglycosylase C